MNEEKAKQKITTQFIDTEKSLAARDFIAKEMIKMVEKEDLIKEIIDLEAASAFISAWGFCNQIYEDLKSEKIERLKKIADDKETMNFLCRQGALSLEEEFNKFKDE